MRQTDIAIIGAGPAGLMAAEVLSLAGLPVDLYDAMPSLGRKFLMAGKGGMNITHAEPTEAFLGRYGERRDELEMLLHGFDAAALRARATLDLARQDRTHTTIVAPIDE